MATSAQCNYLMSFLHFCSVDPQHGLLTTPLVLLQITTLFLLAMLGLNSKF